MKFSVFQLTRRGGREKNEDRMGYCYTREAVMFVLADGMGGHPEGEVAAQLALQSMAAVFQREAAERERTVQCIRRMSRDRRLRPLLSNTFRPKSAGEVGLIPP